MIKFTSPTQYNITDAKTGTVLAERHYDNTVLNPVVNYQGVNVHFSRAPDVGDVFRLQPVVHGLIGRGVIALGNQIGRAHV